MKLLFDKNRTKKAGKKKNNKTKLPIKRKIKLKSKKNKKKTKRKPSKKVSFKDTDNIILNEGPINSNLQNSISKKPKLVLIYAEWCGHCQAMKPHWNEMKSELLQENIYNPNDIIEVESVEQEEKLPKLNHLVTNGSKIHVNGYPTMGKIENGDFKQYVGGRTTMELLNWAKTKQ